MNNYHHQHLWARHPNTEWRTHAACKRCGFAAPLTAFEPPDRERIERGERVEVSEVRRMAKARIAGAP